MSTLCKMLNVKVLFKYNCKIQNLLIKNAPNSKQGLIYKINCKNCDKIYIGQTGRSLETRIKEHSYAIKKKNQYNALFNHYLINGHNCDLDGAEVIYNCNSFHKRNIIESFLINITDNINNHPGMYKVDKISQHFLNKEIKYNL